MIQRLIDHRQALLKAGVSVGPRRPTTLSQFYEVFEQQLTRVHSDYPLGAMARLTPDV
jgi:hypothetical protein